MTTKSAINFRTTYILMGAVGVLLAGLAVYVWLSDDAKPNPQGILLESFHNIGAKPDQITGLEIDRDSVKMVFGRQPDGRWQMIKPIKARADSGLIYELVQQLLAARRDEKNADVLDNLGAHGLDKPSVKITLRRGDRSATLSLGKISAGADQAVVYVLTSDQPKKAQATLKKRLSALFKEKSPDEGATAAQVRDLDDFRTRVLLGEDITPEEAPTRIIGVRATVGKKAVYLKRVDGAWRFQEPAGYGDVEMLKPGDKDFNPTKFQYLTYLLNAILAIKVTSADDFLTSERDLTQLGLDPSNPEALRIDLERDDPIGVETLWLSRMGAKGTGNKVYARYEGEDSVAQVNADRPDRIRSFVQDPSDLRELTLVKLRPDRVDAIDVMQSGKKAFEFRKLGGVGGKWKIYAGDKINDANANEINSLLTQLTQPRAVRGFPPPGATDAALGFDKPAVELRIWEDGIVKAEKEDPLVEPKVGDTPTTRILFGNPEAGELVLVRRFLGAGKVDAKMPATILADAKRERLKYVQVPMVPFKVADVTKVSIPCGNDVYEIERTDATHWTITAPPRKKGKLANSDKINSLVLSLAAMQPLGIAAEKPDLKLENFGLGKPKMRIALQVKGEAAERVWEFGDPVPKTESVYAKSNQADFVIEVSKQYAEIAGQGELVDPHLYQITAAEVEGIKLKGWAEFNKAREYAFVRKPGGLWEAAKKDALVNSQKLETFLSAILNPQAETVVAEKGQPAEFHGLDTNNGALEITIDLGGGKNIVLTLGKFVSKESKLIYALFKGDIITIKAEPLLLDVKDKPAGLQ